MRQSLFPFCSSLVIKKKSNYWKYIEKPDCQKWLPLSTNQNWVICWGFWLQAFPWTHKKQSWRKPQGGGGPREKLPFPLNHFCVFMHVCTQAWLLTWRTSWALKLPSAASVQKKGGGWREGAGGCRLDCPVNSPHTGRCVNTWHEKAVDVTLHTLVERSGASHYATLELLLSAGVRDVQRGRAQGATAPWYGACRCCVWSHCRAKVFHIYRKEEKTLGMAVIGTLFC